MAPTVRKLVLPWRILTFIILIIGLAMALWSGIYLFKTEYTRWELRLQEDVNTALSATQFRWYQLEQDLLNIETLYISSNHVDADEFSLLAQRVLRHHPYLHLLSVTDQPSGADYLVLPAQNQELQTRLQGPLQTLPTLSDAKLTLRPLSPSLLQVFSLHSHVLLQFPIGPRGVYGTLSAVLNLPGFLADIYGVASMAGQRVQVLLGNDAVFTANQGQFDPAAKVFHSVFDWAGATWQVAMAFPEDAHSGVDMLPGLIVLIAALVMTLTFSWTIWRQQGIAQMVHQQVVERTNQLESASRRFRLITDNAYDLIAITSTDGVMEYVNSAYHRVLGYNREELRGMNVTHIAHPAELKNVAAILTDVAQGRNAVEFSFRAKHKSGDWLFMEAVAKGLHDTDWAVKNIVIHCRDVTSRKQFAEDLARSEQRFKDFADASADWLWEVDDQLRFTYVSPGVTHVLGYTADEMIGSMQLDTLFDKEEEVTRELIEKRVHRHQPYKEFEFWTRSRTGDKICLRISGLPVLNEQGQFVGYRGVATNITASQIDRDNMFRLATTDHLTGLLNRRRFMEELERSVNLAKRHSTSGVLMFIDLDRFKEINDTHGHEAGDEILRGITSILKKAFRNTDIIARLGGDEFAIIMHNCDMALAQDKVQDLIDNVSAFEVNYRGARLSVTMSVGIVVYPQEGKDSEGLMMSADLAMYRAKDMGRNRMFVDADDNSNETMDSVRTQLKWVKRLRTCLETGDFEMHFQPIVPAHKRHRPLFEALLRIYDEDGNVGSPALYIDAAEHFGLIQQLDLCVVERCFMLQAELGRLQIDADFSINLSSRSLGDPEVNKAVHRLFDQYDVNPSHVIFEVTETLAIHDPSGMRDIGEVHAFINDLRTMGFRFAIDDFGTGFSSFNYIRLLPVDIVKIDGSFVKDVLTSTQDHLFIQSMVLLCRGMGIQTIAEFVEDENVMAELLRLGVDYSQGWHIGKPHPDVPLLVEHYNGLTMADFEASKSAPKLPFAERQKHQGKPGHVFSQSAATHLQEQNTTRTKARAAQETTKKPKSQPEHQTEPQPKSPTKAKAAKRTRTAKSQ